MDNIREIFEGLDSSQKQAVEQVNGPILIIAGAGSGKTRVLTSKIAYILQKDVTDPERILALTFTKKAAGEMKSRIAAMVGERKARHLYMGTFHSVFIRFLREYSDAIGYPSSFTIYDTSDSVSALKRIIKELQLDEKYYKPKEVLGRISMAKNNLVTAEEYAANAKVVENDRHAKRGEIYKVYAQYQQLMKQAGVMDFDDILMNTFQLLRTNKLALSAIADKFDYILVDEYQDTNFAQYVILKALAKKHRNICVVGDDSQSIYAFRGAKIENILNFKKDYPDCRLYRLEQNYRSTKNIVGAANSLIDKNQSRIPKTCFSEGQQGDKIHLIQAYTEQEEAILITSSIISKMQLCHAKYQDFAILYRTNSQSRAIEESLRKRNLPYMIYSGNSFFERQEVKDMMAYFKLTVNNNDDEAFRRIVNKPARGIGATSLDALSAAAVASRTSLFKAVDLPNLSEFGLKDAAVAKIKVFRDMIAMDTARLGEDDAYVIASHLADISGLYRMHKEDNSIEGQSRAANIEELVNSVKAFVEERQNDMREELMIDDPTEVSISDLPLVTLGEYLENISLLSSVDVADEEDNNKIALMTVHSSKGLEFPHVYVSGMEENLFPSGGMRALPNEIEEERRLFYVALTRAEVSVNLSFASTRMRNGKHESNSPSRFIKEISSNFIDNPLRSSDFDPDYSGPRWSGFGSGASGFRGSATSGSASRSSGSAYGSAVSRGYNAYGSSSRPVSAGTSPGSRSALPSGRSQTVKPSVSPDSSDFIPVSALSLREGQRVEHNHFGFGTILKITGEAADLKALVDFDYHGQRLLLLKYAKLRFA